MKPQIPCAPFVQPPCIYPGRRIFWDHHVQVYEGTLVKRRTFLQLSSAALIGMGNRSPEPAYRVVSAYKPSSQPGMPGPFPGQVVSVRSAKCIDEVKDEVNAAVVREMMGRGMRQLTGESTVLRAWQRFIAPDDVVGIKVNCVGRPKVVSSPEVVAEIVRNLTELGVKPSQICIYDRFAERLIRDELRPAFAQGSSDPRR